MKNGYGEGSLTSDTAAQEVGPPPLPLLDVPWSISVVRPLGDDLARVHVWMSAPHVAAEWNQAWSVERWRAELVDQLAGAHSRPCFVALDGEPLAYVEIYRVMRDRLAPHYPVRPHDLGLHAAIGDPARCGRGLGTALLRAVADGLLAAEPACTRVVAEPDETNAASVVAFGRAGFRAAGRVRFPHKTAALLVRPRTDGDIPLGGPALPPPTV